MTYEENQELVKVLEKSSGTWYHVCYCLPHLGETFYDVRRTNRSDGYSRQQLKLINMNDIGTGAVFFVNKENQLVTLDWRNIISMIPMDNK